MKGDTAVPEPGVCMWACASVVSKKSVGVLQRHVRENPKWPVIGTFLACHCDAAIPHAVAEPNCPNSCYLAIDMRKPQC